MTFEEYQKISRKTALYPKILGHSFLYPTLGLAGEAGEVAEKIKKIYRDREGKVDGSDKEEIMKELGDVSLVCFSISHRIRSFIGGDSSTQY